MQEWPGQAVLVVDQLMWTEEVAAAIPTGGAMVNEHKTHVATLNPKLIKMGHLYGCFDDVSHEWTIGILAVLYRNFARGQSEDRKWLRAIRPDRLIPAIMDVVKNAMGEDFITPPPFELPGSYGDSTNVR